MFLHHPLVPDSVKQSQSDVINIRDIVNKKLLEQEDINELLEILKDYDDYSVIRLYNLHNITVLEKSQIWQRFSGI